MKSPKLKLQGFHLIVTIESCVCIFVCNIFFCPLDCFISPYFSPIPPDFGFKPRQYVNNTDTFIRRQNSLPFTLAGLLPSPLLSLSSFFLPPSLLLLIPLSFPLSWLFPDRPTANVHQMPPQLHPISQPVTAHSSVQYRQMELLSVLASLSQPLSPTLHTVYFVFLFLIPYQVKNK